MIYNRIPLPYGMAANTAPFNTEYIAIANAVNNLDDTNVGTPFTGNVLDLTEPGPIGGTTPSTGAFTTVTSTTGNITTVNATTITDGTFSVTGGVITGATGNISMFTNNANYIDLTDLSTTVTGLTYTNTTGVLSLTAGYVIPTTTEETNWNTAYGWGDHALVGYFIGTSTTIRALISTTVTGLTYTSVTGVLSTTAGYGIPTTVKQGQWDTAYGWGNHASAGYLTPASLTNYSGHIKLNDNYRVYFGTSSDLEIYHNGTNSIINNITGSLYFYSTTGSYVFDTDTSAVPVAITRDGGTDQAIGISVDDNLVRFCSVQDEAATGSFSFYGNATSTVNGTAKDANYVYYNIYNCRLRLYNVGATNYATLYEDSDDFYIENSVSNGDIFVKINDGGVVREAIRVIGASNTVAINYNSALAGGNFRVYNGNNTEYIQLGFSGSNAMISTDDNIIYMPTIVVDTAPAAPASPVVGMIYYNTMSSHFYGYNGAWRQLDN